MTKYIVVCGGVISGIGKGIIASSTGLLMKSLGLRVSAIKIDPYLNIDAGTMSPLDHGEVFVLNDGGEVDLDLGNYERFLDVQLTRDNNITTGKVYREVIERERRGDYLGKTVQVVPHITDSIQQWLERVGKVSVDGSGQEPDVCIVELGGTVGDIESAPFVEALRQFQFHVGPQNFCLVMVSLVPVVGAVNEQKTKPTQACARDLRGLGLNPDVIACRSTKPLGDGIKEKISMFCHVGKDQVLTVHDCQSIHHVPFLLKEQGLVDYLTKKLELRPPARSPWGADFLTKWQHLADTYTKAHESVRIVLVGKYTHLQDSYISVVKALQHASLAIERKLVLEWVEAEELEEPAKTANPVKYHDAWKKLCTAGGVLVPGGFGNRGTEGKILAIQWARENQIPFLGICLGMQLAVVEFARNVLGLKGAHSEEFDKQTTNKMVVFMPEVSKTHMGGTMRLGSRETVFVDRHRAKPSTVRQLYFPKSDPKDTTTPLTINERHRHRYEVNAEYVPQLEEKGMLFIGEDVDGERMEVVEVQDHTYFVGCQFHPEYLSRPLRPSPVFLGLVSKAAGLELPQ